jgi:uncharacterized protein YjiS (DUF1127 family)
VLVVTGGVARHQLYLSDMREDDGESHDRNVKPDPISARATVVIDAIVAYGRAWRQYEATVGELSSMNNRELADLGITRSDIPRVAWYADALSSNTAETAQNQ